MPEETGTPTTIQEETPKTFTQEEVNKMIGARLDRERAKFSDYEALKADAEAYREIQEAQKSELEKAREQIASLQAEKAAREEADAHDKLVRKIMSDHSVDAEFAPLLTGKTEEELIEQAQLIGKRFAEPSKNERQAPASVDAKDWEKREFARSFFNSNEE